MKVLRLMVDIKRIEQQPPSLDALLIAEKIRTSKDFEIRKEMKKDDVWKAVKRVMYWPQFDKAVKQLIDEEFLLEVEYPTVQLTERLEITKGEAFEFFDWLTFEEAIDMMKDGGVTAEDLEVLYLDFLNDKCSE